MHHDHSLSSTHEMYLKVLFRLEEDHESGRVRDLAKGLGVTASTVSAVLKKLQQEGLVRHDRYGVVKLEPAGRRAARCVVRRFDILKEFLTGVLGVDADDAEVDACQMEHSVSPATINRLESFLGMVKSGEIAIGGFAKDSDPRTECADCGATRECQAASARQN